MILTDAGPLAALVNPADSYHRQAMELSRYLGTETMLTTWQCLTEAMHFAGQAGGFHYQARLWQMLQSGRLQVHSTTASESGRMQQLMRQYQDSPMDFADASLIAAAESLSLRRVFSADRGFYFFRLADGSMLQVVK